LFDSLFNLYIINLSLLLKTYVIVSFAIITAYHIAQPVMEPVEYIAA
jgi:hypothetical protein